MRRTLARSICFLLILFTQSLRAQGPLQQELVRRKGHTQYHLVQTFYQSNDYRYAWLGQPDQVQEMLRLFREAPSLALDTRTYSSSDFDRFLSGTTLSGRDSARIEITLTESALLFFSGLRGGKSKPAFRYDGAGFRPSYEDLPAHLHRAIGSGRLAQLAADMQPNSPADLLMIALLRRLQSVRQASGFREVFAPVQPAERNTAFWERLYYYGIHDSTTMPANASLRLQRIREAQRLFDVNEDGKIRSSFIQALNRPIEQRIRELVESINIVRWAEAWKQQPLNGLLNIPAALAQITQEGQTVLVTKVIVGKPTTQTPTLTSVIREVVLYPYWYVPRSIAVKELLPGIRRNIGYLEENRYQVLNDQGKVLNPYAINWSAYDASYFPFTIRQSTGCDNSLGLFKFQFDNPFSVYWHDTPNKGLFALARRYLSHGCMRIEKAEELGQFVLGANRVAIDTLTEKGCLLNQKPIVLPVARPMPIAVVYSTVWLEADGRLRFYDDVYRKRR